MSGAAPGGRPVTEVAVGVLIRADGAVLLADRPAGKPYAGYWEFPGGKIEAGESVDAALARELHEELGVAAAPSEPWVVMEHDYPHAYVRLHFRRIRAWQGTPRPIEGQRLCFLAPGAPPPQPLLPASLPALRWITLPTSCVRSPGTAAQAEQALAWLEDALGRGVRLLVWHEPGLPPAQRAAALAAARALAQDYGARLLADARSQAPGTPSADADGFLPLEALRAATVRPGTGWLGAAAQEAADLARAVRLGCDFALIEAADPLHARALCAAAPLPVYIAGALNCVALAQARAAGAQGLAPPGLPI